MAARVGDAFASVVTNFEEASINLQLKGVTVNRQPTRNKHSL